MGILQDVITALDQIPLWKKLKNAPEQIQALEKRVAELEKRLENPGDACPRCGKLAFRVVSERPHNDPDLGSLGLTVRNMKCQECGFESSRTLDIKSRR